MVIDGVEQADRGVNEFVVAPGPQFHAKEGVVGGNALPGARKKSQECGAIVPGKVEAVIVFSERQSDPIEGVIRFSTDLEDLVDASDSRNEFLYGGRDDERDRCTREFFAERSNGGRRQDQIADSLELEEENVHEGEEENAQRPTSNVQSRMKKRSAVVSGIRDSAFGVGRSAFCFTRLALHPHRLFIADEQTSPEMVPGEIVHNPATRMLSRQYFFKCGLASSWTAPTSQSSASFRSSRCQASSK